jgi:hypothetical protein
MTTPSLQLEQRLRRIVHRARTRWCERKAPSRKLTPPGRRAGAKSWQRVLFVLGLAVPILALLVLLMLR